MSAYQDYVKSLTPNHYWTFETDSSDSGYGSATNSTIFDAVGVFDVALIGTDTSGFITTYDVGKLEILAVL